MYVHATRTDVKVYKKAMDPKIIFRCPAYVVGIAREIAQYSGEIEGQLPDDAIQAAAILHGYADQMIQVVFPEPVDPGEAPTESVEAVAKELRGQPYAYWTDAWIEPTRGVRVLGCVVYDVGAGERRVRIPWQHGEPDLDVATLTAGGMDRSEAEAVVSRFAS